MFRKINKCRICGNSNLIQVLDLGNQVLTGVFPNSASQVITRGPLRLEVCAGGENSCGLLQLAHTYDHKEMYGDNYGYRSSLNNSMVRHLRGKVEKIVGIAGLEKRDLVIDIGSNDGTTLAAYPDGPYSLVGIDPTGMKFRKFYPPHIDLIPDFFSAAKIVDAYPGQKAKVVTSFSMFYDLDDPTQFMREICELLDDNGIWVLEQSYMPTMLAMKSYDTVCHEHLEYYGLGQIKWMTDNVGLKIIDVEFNTINGGSFSVTVVKEASRRMASPNVARVLEEESRSGFRSISTYRTFAADAERSRDEVMGFLERTRAAGQVVLGLGASTKGNVLMQYCNITQKHLPCIGEVNANKFGCYTPGTLVPIVPEDEVLARNPDYLFVLPWQFREFFETSPRFRGRSLVFPLPVLETVTAA